MQNSLEMDSSFLQQETPRTPMHISPIWFTTSRRARTTRAVQEILTTFWCNLHKSTIFRRKLAGGAFGLDTPYWVEDPDFDLEFPFAISPCRSPVTGASSAYCWRGCASRPGYEAPCGKPT